MSDDTKIERTFLLRRMEDRGEESVRNAILSFGKELKKNPEDWPLFVIRDCLSDFVERNQSLWCCFVEVANLEAREGYAFTTKLLGLPEVPFMGVYKTETPGHAFGKDRSNEFLSWIDHWEERWGEKFGKTPWNYMLLVASGTRTLLELGWKVVDFSEVSEDKAYATYVSKIGDKAVVIAVDLTVASRDTEELLKQVNNQKKQAEGEQR